MNMNDMRRRGFLRAGIASGAGLLVPAAWAHEYFSTNFTLIHPWTRASAPAATTAMVCMTFDDVTETDRLIGATTMLAEGAEFGGKAAGTALDIVIPKQQKTEFSEAGAHVRLVRLRQPLEMGREYPITLVFAKAGSLRATFLVDFPAGT
jgi:copper(I)-binding protein